MHDEEDKEITRILSARAAPPPPPADLNARIIAAAAQGREYSVRRAPFWAQIVSDVQAMIVLPNPRLALAACLVFGIVAGVQAGEGLSILTQDWSAFLEINEGGWL